MYLIVRQNDNVIIGTAVNTLNVDALSKQGYILCEIPDNEFTLDLLGSKIENYEDWKD